MPRYSLNFSVWLAVVVRFSVSAATFQVSQRNPQANDANPGSLARPWKTIAHAAEKAGPGDTVLIGDGVYRERIVAKVSGAAEAPIIFESSPGAHVIVTGADRLTGWKKIKNGTPIYQVPWPHRFIGWSKQMTHPDDEYHLLIGRCEQVAVDNYLLRQVLAFSQIAPGTFFVDVSNQVLFVEDAGRRDLNKVLVEASVRQEIFRVEGSYVHVRGLHFRFAANMAQHGGVVLTGKHDILEDCIVEFMNSSGASFSGEEQVVRRCVFRENGQLGFGANGAHGLLFTDCLVENNNIKGFDRGWEAGGDKLVLCRNAVLERSRFLRNRGNGIWFDIGNEQCTVRHCLIAENEGSGIFYEISYGLQAHDNAITENGFSQTTGAWGAQAGISLSSSPNCVVERNLIVGNREGFNFREQTRTTARIDQKGEVPIWNHDEIVRRNIIALNRDAQIWGWFDVKDNRHWPDEAKQKEIVSNELTLAKLRLSLLENIYFAEPGQGWFEWGVTWAQHKSYGNLSDFQTDLGIDVGSHVFVTRFANVNALDFRIASGTTAEVKTSYPEAPVPGVILGVEQ